MNRLIGIHLLLSASLASAADWPQWRGPERTGVSKETGLLKKWPDKGPPVVWKYGDAGLGFSSFAVVKGTLYTLGTRGEDEIVIALDAAKGKELWTAKIGPIFTFKGNQWGDGPRSTPTIDGNFLYALGGQGELVCLDVAQKGKELWRKNLITDFKGVMMSEWGYSESPLVDGDQLICTPGGPEGTVAALNKKTGAVLWRTKELTNKAPYSSAVAADIQGTRQYIQTSFVDDKAGGVVSGIGAKDGKVLWTMPMFSGPSYAIGPTPIVVGNTVLVTANSLNATHAFEIGPDFKATDKYPLKNQKNLKNFHGGVVLVEGNLYAHTDSLGWVCVDWKTGNLRWDEKNALECRSGSLTAADGCLYLYSEDGEVVLLEANPKDWTEIGRFKIPESSKAPETRTTSVSSKTWAHPVIANGHLFLRDHELIFCYDVRAAK